MIRRIILVTVAATMMSGAPTMAAPAWDTEQADDDSPPTVSPPTGWSLSAGRVIRINTATGKIMIEHKPIAHLYMEAMTMIFRVADPAMLTALAPGDKIRFEVRRDSGGYIITKIENSN